MTSASTPSVNEAATASFSPHSKTKATNLRKTSGISDAATASVNSEKTRYEEVADDDDNDIIIIIMNKSQESTVFHGRQKMASAMKQRPEK